MIEIKELRKSYRTGSFVNHALDGVSINFRDILESAPYKLFINILSSSSELSKYDDLFSS